MNYKDIAKDKAFVMLLNCFKVLTLFLVFNMSSKSNYAFINTNYEVRTVVIDPGHGGHDPGCHGAHSNEKHITLSVALKLGSYIEQSFPGVNVIYTRKTDKFVELDERANIANRNDADLFISIHCNAAANKNVNGTETYVMGLHRSKANLDVAKRENEVIMLEDDYLEKYDGFNPSSPEAHIVFTLYQNAFIDQSILFADLVEKQFKDRAMRYSRGVKQAGFLVLYKTNMPSALIESGFLTNREEENYLASGHGQDIIASAIFRAFREYKEKIEQKSSWPVSISSYEEDYSSESYESYETSESESYTLKAMPSGVDRPVIETSSSESVEATESDVVIKYYPAKKEAVSPVRDESIPLTYKVQIFASKDGEMLKEVNYNVIKRIETEEGSTGIVKYMTGNFKDFKKVEAYLEEVRNSGFKDAFIVRYQAGERI